MKKILSFALVLVMVLSCMPIQAFAAENEETAYVAINKTTGKGYESLAVAMAECRKGETVALQKDASEGQILVPANGTLDLNGCTLEAEYMSCFGSLIDGSDDNSGLLKTNEDYFMIREDNKQLPIKDGTGYRFVEITKINTKMLSPTKFVFQPLFEAAALDLIAKGGDVTGLTVQVLVSWKQDEGYRTQQFVYDDNLLTQFLDSYNATTGKYGKMFTLTLNNVDGIEELSFAAVLASSTKVTISSNDPVEEDEEIFSASTNLSKDDLIYGTLANEVTISGTTGVSAVVPAAVKVETGAAALALSVKKAETGSEITLGAGESAQSLDVHIAGVAADNKVPMIVNLGAILEKGLSDTELKLYHTENGVAVLMTRVASAADFAIHNQYTYNPETGEVSIYVASFSVFSAVNTTVDVWDGTEDTSWYNENNTEFTLNTAEQFAGFRALVDGGNTFEGKTIILGTDIDLNKILFNPIGRGYVNNGGQAFMGTFDGANHTVYNLYQNGWELGDSYNTAGAGLFASIQNATIKNLAVCGANIVFECVDMGIVVGYAQGTCHFENIVVTNSTIANYNRSTGGVVGEVCYGPTDVEFSHTFKNITVDSSVKISSLWGSFDTLCGGVIGGKWGDATVKMENITVACELDVFSDVTAAYRWYAYRRCGMLIGYTEQESPKKASNAAADFLTCENVEVYYGDWVNYTYYEFADQESGTGRNYPWVRAEAGEHNEAFSNPRYGVPTYDGVKVTDGSKATDSANITFGQLYGGGQGIYGVNEHTGVSVKDKFAQTIYIMNDQNWENLKLQYWYKNGDDIWSTIVEGIDMSTMLLENGIYKVDLPTYVYAFKIVGDDVAGNEILLANVIENETYTLNGEHVSHKYENGACTVCGVIEKKETITGIVATDKFAPLGIISGYDTYVADWQAGLALPTEVTVEGSDGDTDTATIVWDYSTLNLNKVGKYTLVGKLASDVYSNPENLTVKQVIYVNEKTNIVTNGYFDNGTTGWGGSWSVVKVEYPAGSGNYVLKKYSAAADNNVQFLYQNDTTAAAKSLLAYGVGQYLVSVDAMAAPYNDETAAREDLQVILDQRYWTATDTNSVGAATAVTKPVSSTAWTNLTQTVTVTREWTKIRTDIKSKISTTGQPAAYYIDNVEIIPLRVTLTTPPIDIVSVETETTPLQIVAGYDKYVGADWKTQLGLITEATVTGADGKTATAAIEWDYAPLGDLTKTGKYVIEGKLSSETYSNYDNVTIKQVIYVREAENLLPYGDFEATKSSITSYLYIGGSIAVVQEPVVGGKNAMYTKLSTTATGNYQLAYHHSGKCAEIGAKVNALGAGDYYFGVYVKLGNLGTISTTSAETGETVETPDTAAKTMNVQLQHSKDAGTTKTNATTSDIALNSDKYTKISRTVSLSADVNWIRVFLNYKGANKPNDEVYLDNLELIPLRVELKTLPVEIESVETETTPLQIVAGYDKYVGADWQAQLGLITEATVKGSDGNTATAAIEWDYAPLGDLTKTGKYVIEGKLSCDAYYNFENVTIKQTIVIVEPVNLFANGDFEDCSTAPTGWYTPGGGNRYTAEDEYVLSGERAGWARGSDATSDKRNGYNYSGDDAPAAVGARIGAAGAGQYYFGIYARKGDSDVDVNFYAQMYYRYDEMTSSKNFEANTVELTTEYQASSVIRDMPANVTYLQMQYNFTKTDTTVTWNDIGAYFDLAEIVLLKTEYIGPAE